MRLDQSRCDEDQKKRLSRLSGEREQLRVIRVHTCATFLANKCSLTTTSALIFPHFALAFTGIIIIAAVCATIFSLEERRGKKIVARKRNQRALFRDERYDSAESAENNRLSRLQVGLQNKMRDTDRHAGFCRRLNYSYQRTPLKQ